MMEFYRYWQTELNDIENCARLVAGLLPSRYASDRFQAEALELFGRGLWHT
jgi:hypothetical protein